MEVTIGRDSITRKSVKLMAIKLIRILLVILVSPESEGDKIDSVRFMPLDFALRNSYCNVFAVLSLPRMYQKIYTTFA